MVINKKLKVIIEEKNMCPSVLSAIGACHLLLVYVPIPIFSRLISSTFINNCQ